MHVVYVIQHTTNKDIYIGVTSDLTKRLQQHNNNENISTRRLNGKWILIYAEAYRSKIDAYSRESKLKHHGSGKHELYKRLNNSFVQKF